MDKKNSKSNFRTALRDVLQITHPDAVLSDEQVQKAYDGLLTILMQYKKETVSMNEETKALFQEFQNSVDDYHDRIIKGIEERSGSFSSEFTKKEQETLKKLADTLKEVKSYAALKPLDGKDAKPEDVAPLVVPLVMDQIKLPEYKEVVLDNAEQLRDKLESLEDEDRLDISAIKGADKFSTKSDIENIRGLVGRIPHGAGNVEVFKNGSKIGSGAAIDFRGAGVGAVTNRDGHTTVVTISGGGGEGGGQVNEVVAGTGISVDSTDPAAPIVSTTITQYTDEMAQDAVGNAVGNGLDYDDGTGAISVDETELAHNSIGSKQGGTTNEYYHLTAAQHTVFAAVTSSAAELNILDGATLTTAELNYVDGVTSAIQTQLDAKAPLASPTFTGTMTIPAATVTGNINFSAVPASDHTAIGPTMSAFNLGATIALMDLVYLGSSSKWLLTDADAAATSGGLLGICLDGGVDTDTTTVALPGSLVRDDTWNWTPGATLYIDTDTPGALTATKPSGTDDAIRVVGFAVTADVIYFAPSADYITST